jgi:hypothetical protein
MLVLAMKFSRCASPRGSAFATERGRTMPKAQAALGGRPPPAGGQGGGQGRGRAFKTEQKDPVDRPGPIRRTSPTTNGLNGKTINQ